MTALLRDARFGLRLMRTSPGFTAAAVLALAIGIASTTAIFSVVYGTFFAPLPYRDPAALVMVWSKYRGERVQATPSDYLEWRRGSTTFSDLNAWGGRTVNVATAERPENLQAGLATPGFLGMLGYGHPLALGRSFVEDEGIPGRDHVVILSYRIWQDRFGGDQSIVGKPIRLDGEPYIVVGVLGAGPADNTQNKLWLPMAFTPEQLAGRSHSLHVMGRLKPDVTLAQANANVGAVSAALEERSPETHKDWKSSVEPFRNNFVRDNIKQGLWLLLGAVAFLLLIACANVANLLLARGSIRQRELAVRSAMGASDAAIVRQLLVESLVLALVGGVLGAVMASGLLDVIVALMPEYTLPSETEITLSVPVLLFAFTVCLIAGVVSGCAPAWQAARANLVETMKEGGRSVSGGRQALRRVLVVLEVALALTLLAAGGIAMHALIRTINTNLGFRAENVVIFDLPVARGRLTTPAEVEAFYRSLLDGVSAIPGVASASLSTGLPIDGIRFGDGFDIVGRPVRSGGDRPGAGINMVTPAYYETLGIPILRGRAFTELDRAGAVRVAIVNDEFVRRHLSNVEPVGQRFRTANWNHDMEDGAVPETIEWQIVGVYGRVMNGGPGRDPFPEMDLPFWQRPHRRATVTVRTSADAAAVHQSVAAIVQKLDPELPVANVRTMEQVVSEAMAADRFHSVLFAAFAAVALVLAGLGIYSVMSFVVAQRTHEIGLRMALGAGRRRVLVDVLRDGLTTALIGVAIGAIGAVVVSRLMVGMVTGANSADPLAFAVVALMLLGAAVVACLVPACRAASVDPMVALRQD